GAVLVGDAAGYFDPLTGQGVYRALRSAELAAPAALAWLRGDGGAGFAAYQRQLRAEFGPAERWQRLIDALVRRPAALGAGLGLVRIFPPAGRRLLGLIGDCDKGVTG
ncbi:MAG TPA: hypothetical protein VD902_10355, partial [Symbiobacteriaceae bacterium]|nr:hypothetical protein [Symbiobacteriaceae bacterium]